MNVTESPHCSGTSSGPSNWVSLVRTLSVPPGPLSLAVGDLGPVGGRSDPGLPVESVTALAFLGLTKPLRE